MRIVVPKGTRHDETRVAMIPEIVRKLVDLGADVLIEAGFGASIKQTDPAYEAAGATIFSDLEPALRGAGMVLRLSPPTQAEVSQLSPGTIHVSYVDPFNDIDLVQKLADQKVSALCMELIPRSTTAQKMDALSSQANLAGYAAVLVAVNALDKIVPMMMTPAGTLSPARIFIIGAGVAGLQAIATAKRLGARIEAFDTRPVVEEQVLSLGARFLKVDLGETGQTEGGYARQLTDEQIEKQRQAMAKACAQADVVITTAQVFGRQAPRIVTEEMVKGMKPGSVVLDMAVDSGGNVAGSKPDEVVDIDGVRVLGYGNLARSVPVDASQMYASNLFNLIEHFWDKDAKAFALNREDEIIAGALLTHEGDVVNKMIKERMA